MTANEVRDLHNHNMYSFKPKTDKQHRYLQQQLAPDTRISFGIGPSGTGKSIVSLHAALSLYQRREIERIIVVTEACPLGMDIGYLKGSAEDKMQPYFDSVLDNLYEISGDITRIDKMIEDKIIQFRAINFIRGATFRRAAVIFDEAQNTSPASMKAFLTRIGENSRLFINGDENQVDDKSLTNGRNGLADARRRLEGRHDSIKFTIFTRKDSVRDPILTFILDAYEEA